MIDLYDFLMGFPPKTFNDAISTMKEEWEETKLWPIEYASIAHTHENYVGLEKARRYWKFFNHSYTHTMCQRKFFLETMLKWKSIPTTDTLYFLDREHWYANDALLPHWDEPLFGKPNIGFSGKDCHVFFEKTRFSLDTIETLVNKYNKDGYLLQKFISNHSAIVLFTKSDVLATFRLTMLKDKLLNVLMKLPSKDSKDVDNFAYRGNHVVNVYDNGVTDTVMYSLYDRSSFPLERSPLAVPFYREMVEIVKKAQQEVFCNSALIGWDVAIDDNGPRIIEANSRPAFDFVQLTLRRGLLDDVEAYLSADDQKVMDRKMRSETNYFDRQNRKTFRLLWLASYFPRYKERLVRRACDIQYALVNRTVGSPLP